MADFNEGQKSRRPASDYYFQNKMITSENRRLDDLLKNFPEDRLVEVLLNFTSPERKILPARRTGCTAKHQRQTARAIRRARAINLVAFYDQDA